MHLAIPRQRAVLGGLLIASAAALAFIVAARGTATATTAIVVARHDIALGSRIESSDIELRQVALNDQLASHGFDSTDALIGSSTLAPIASGELLQRSAVRSGSSGGARGFSFAVQRAHAVDGDLRSGDIVDVLATYGTGLDAETRVLARSVRISRISGDDTAASTGQSDLIITASLDDPERTLDLAHAAQTASLTVVRTTGAPSATGGRDVATTPGSPLVTFGGPAPTAVFP